MSTTTPLALDRQITISVYLRRDMHDNGMTLEEYANSVVAGTQPILDHDEYVYQFGAVADELDLVVEWAGANNLTVVESGLGTASVKLLGTAEQYNALFDIQLEQVVDGSRTYITHSGNITIPGEINSVVQAVLGLDNSASLTHDAILDSNGPVDIENLPPSLDPNVISYPTPVDLALAYQFPRAAGTDLVQGAGTCVGIIELGGGWTTQNLTSTFTRIGQPNPTVVDVSVDGGVNDGGVDLGSSGEVMLDIYCVGAVAPAATIAMYFAPNSYQGFVDTISTAANDTVNNPSVLSISWGTVDTYWSTPARLAFDTNLQAAIVKGINTFVAIGDYGTQGISGSATYTVQYPGTSPYAISAGGTVISVNTDHTIASEIAWKSGSSYATGGGYSSIYSIPSWQAGKSFSYKTYPTGTVTSLTTRGVPDMSAMATGYQFYYGAANYTGTFLGTSAVAPLLAGMMARINSITGQRNGFINPIVYENQSAFNDITTGNNAAPAAIGYSATAGWDACTGLGSPIGTAILALFTTPTSVLTSTVAVSHVSLTKDQAMTPVAPVTASGGITPYTWSISPAISGITNLTFNTSSGVISGTPTVLHSTSSYSITVTDSSATSVSQSFTLAVTATPPPPPPSPTYSITESASTITEGQSVRFNVVTTNVTNGTTLYWINTGTTNSVDFTDSVNSGSFTISNNTATIIRTLNTDLTIEPTETIILQLFTTTIGTVVATSGVVSVVDTSPAATYSITPSTTRLIEGQSVAYRINTTAVSNGTSLYWTNDGTATLEQITVNSGTFTINSSTAIVTISSHNVGTSNGESIIFDVRTGSTSGPIVGTAPTVNVYQPIITSIDVAVRSFTTGVPVNPFTPVPAHGGYSTLTWSVNPGLPGGLTLNPLNGQISGRPTGSSAPALYTITVTDAIGQTSSRSVSFNVISNILEISPSRKEMSVGVYDHPIDPYQPVIITHQGNGTITWSITPALPPGVSFNTNTGIISGRPQVKESVATYTVTVTDQSGQSVATDVGFKIVRSSDLILSDYYNFLYDNLFDLLGTTSTGYGAVLLGRDPVLVGQPVKAIEWNQMHDDMVRCIVHQNGTSTNNLILAHTGTIADNSVPDRTWTELQFLELNPDKIANNQKATMRVNTYEVSRDQWESDWTYTTSTNTSSWTTITSNGYITSVSYTWFHPIQLHYFFNLGGNIKPELQTTSTFASVWQAWQPLIAVANTISFGKLEFNEAIANAGLYRRIISGGGQKGKTSKALMITYQIIGAVLTASIEFLADYHKKKKKKSNKKGKGKGGSNYIVRLKIISDFVTTYSTDYWGGIKAPIPQSQLMGNTLSAPAAPIPIFSFATETTSTNRTIILRNNSTQTCNISNISLTGYTTGTVSTSTMVIAPHTSNSFSLNYSGNKAGYYRGFVRILSNVNNLTLFTEINIGGVTPTHLTLTTTTNDLIVQDFIVDHAGGQYRDFIIAPFTSPQYSYELISSGLYEAGGFRVTFNPHGLPNGMHTENVQVTVLPLDTALDSVTISVPINITTNIDNHEIGHWISAKGNNKDVIGFSYGYIGGHKYITVGVGSVALSSPSLAQLRSENTFSTWQEVFRIPLGNNVADIFHVGEYQIYGPASTLSHYFGVGNALRSVCSIKDDGCGNLSIVMNTLREYADNVSIQSTLDGLVNSFYYYDETSSRQNQLENRADLVDGILTHYFAGFNYNGKVITTLVNPNLLSN